MFLRILLPVVIAYPLLAQGVKIQFEPVEETVIKARLERNPATNGERAAALHKIFEEAGCSGAMLADQAVADARQPNVICTFAGGTASTTSARPVTAASGRPPPSVLPETSRSGWTP